MKAVIKLNMETAGPLAERVRQMTNIMCGLCLHYATKSGRYTPYDMDHAVKHGVAAEFFRLYNCVWDSGVESVDTDVFKEWWEQWVDMLEWATARYTALQSECMADMQPFVESVLAQIKMFARLMADVRHEAQAAIPGMTLSSVQLVDVLQATGGLSDP